MSRGQKRGTLIGLVLLLWLWQGHAFPADNQATRKTLHDVQPIKVVVEPLKWSIENAGLKTRQLRNDTELKLRLAGIRVVSPNDPGKPSLRVNARVIKFGQRDRYIFNIAVEFVQTVSLGRRPQIKTDAVTWSTAVTGTSRKLSTVRDQVGELVDVFINAYLSVNPD
jgi:hypothetical protein